MPSKKRKKFKYQPGGFVNNYNNNNSGWYGSYDASGVNPYGNFLNTPGQDNNPYTGGYGQPPDPNEPGLPINDPNGYLTDGRPTWTYGRDGSPGGNTDFSCMEFINGTWVDTCAPPPPHDPYTAPNNNNQGNTDPIPGMFDNMNLAPFLGALQEMRDLQENPGQKRFDYTPYETGQFKGYGPTGLGFGKRNYQMGGSVFEGMNKSEMKDYFETLASYGSEEELDKELKDYAKWEDTYHGKELMTPHQQEVSTGPTMTYGNNTLWHSPEARENYNMIYGDGARTRGYQGGGIVNTTGYTDGAPTAQNPVNIIPSNQITMKNTSQPLLAVPDTGNVQVMTPGRDYSFPGASSVMEVPMMQKGGEAFNKDQNMLTEAVRGRLYANLYPFTYDDGAKRLTNALILNKLDPYYEKYARHTNQKDKDLLDVRKEHGKSNPERMDAWATYLGLPQANDTLQRSKHKPSKAKDSKAEYLSFKPEVEEKIFNSYMKDGGLWRKEGEDHTILYDDQANVMGDYKLQEGKDDKGHYVSYYDKWDLKGLSAAKIGKPYEIYGRVYFDPKTKKPVKKQMGGSVEDLISQFSDLFH